MSTQPPPRRPLIAGNWKMNGSRAEVLTWAQAARATAGATSAEVALFPAHAWLGTVADVLDVPNGRVALGGQSCHPKASGAFTGAVAAEMLRDLGCRYVLCGHSERRHVFGESDAFVAESLAAAQRAGLTPVLCVGEQIEEREAGQTDEVLARQLDAGLDALIDAGAPLVVAYEPVWAIGTGKAATPIEAAEAHAFLRSRVAERDADRAAALRILYGGSVNGDNIGGFLAVPDVDGALVGGAALDPEGFARIAIAGNFDD